MFHLYLMHCTHFASFDIWDKVCKSGQSKFCGKQSLKVSRDISRPYPLKFFKGCLPKNLLSLEYFVPYIPQLTLFSPTGHLNTSGITSHGTDSFRVNPITPGHPIPKISTHLTIFWGEGRGTWKTEFVKTIHRQDKSGLHQKRNQVDSTRNAQWSCGQF